MADIILKNINHSYPARKEEKPSKALTNINVVFKSGGAYALLGPSGCGKTTMLNIISGLLQPTSGQVFFDETDVTNVPTVKRSLAQVFQFPVIYDTMSVFDNLAFPLRNHGIVERKVKERVHLIADMLDLNDQLMNRASGLSADSKQKISLGRGLVREDVNIIMFDEPLTVIDPHLKWKLRIQLKAVHKKIGSTLIYVTHDQTEALTFADQVMVMHEGEIVQNGTPTELFEKSKHVFVGHFIGSPGMNILPVEIKNEKFYLSEHEIISSGQNLPMCNSGDVFQLGIRPEFVELVSEGIPVEITNVKDLGRYKVVDIKLQELTLKMILAETEVIPPHPCIKFVPTHTHLYQNGWLAVSNLTFNHG